MHANESEHLALLIGEIRGLAPLVAQHREALDRDRRIPKPMFDALAELDLFRLWLPKALGGKEVAPLDYLRIIEAVSTLDGSIGWVVANGAGMSRAAGYLPEAVARAWYASPQDFCVAATGAVGVAKPVAGGYRVSGCWPFGSGAHHATRFMGMCRVEDPAITDPEFRLLCYLPPEQVKVIDNWHVSGLRGTGSCDFSTDDVFVPAAHTHPFFDPKPTQPGIVYRLPQVAIFGMSICAVPLGIAAGALAGFIELAQYRSRQGASQVLRDREIVQAEVGRVQAMLAAARALLASAAAELMAAVAVGGDRMISARVDFRAACTFTAETAIRVVDTLAATAGAISISERCPLERHMRDVQAGAKHIAMSSNNYLIAGRVALGLRPSNPRF